MKFRPMVPTLFALLAAAAAVVFLAISIDSGIYAPGAHNYGREARVLGSVAHHVPPRFQHDLAPSRVFRKVYSVVAFAVVGFFAAPLVPSNRRIAICALLVAAFSFTIEIAQRLTVSQESNLSSVFDIGCGAIGGLIGAVLWNTLARRFQFKGVF